MDNKSLVVSCVKQDVFKNEIILMNYYIVEL